MKLLRLCAIGWLVASCGGAPAADRSAPAAGSAVPAPPVADTRPHPIASPHGTRVDPYYWLRDDTRTDESVLAYLRAENAYADAVLASTRALQDELFAEIVGRIQRADVTVPVFDRGYWYYRRFDADSEYPTIARRKGTMQAAEEVVLDVAAVAEGEAFYQLGGAAVSADNRLLAYTEDVVGRNQFRLRVKDLATGALLPDMVTGVAPSVEWANDDTTIFYIVNDPTTLRSYRVMRHRLGDDPKLDAVVYEEPDDTFEVDLDRTKSERFVMIGLVSTTMTEIRLVDADRPDAAPVVFFPRERDHEYQIDHLDGRFVIRTNWEAVNFRLMQVGDADHARRAAWRELLAHRDDAFVHSFAVFRGFVAVSERSEALRKVRVLPADGRDPFVIDAPEPTYTMDVVDLPDPDSRVVRYSYTSLATPLSTYEQDVATGSRVLLKRTPVLGGFDANDYTTELVYATARDGTRVPVSLAHRKTVSRDGTAPLLLRGYGAYGESYDPEFSMWLVSLLDRGFVVGIAHVRGGQELGRRWYDDGKLLRKLNTFTDFIDVTRWLVDNRYAAANQVFADGGSAGGLLVGAVVNMAPELYRGVIAEVPFVDVVTTMLDDTIPLTTFEYDEWGDPRIDEYYDYMLSYSPYDNVRAQAYPAMLVTTGLWDSQVQYYEPAKWVAKLRAHKTDDNPLLLVIDMTSGHQGKSGRFQAYRELAREIAFVLHVLGRTVAAD